MRRLATSALVAVFLMAGEASAQVVAAGDRSAAGSWEVGGGVTWGGSITGPASTAELTSNGESSGGFDLFSTEGEIENGVGIGASLAFYLSPAIAVEAGLRYSQPVLTYRLADDVENAPPVSAEETLSRYVITASVIWHFRRLTSAQPYRALHRWWGRICPRFARRECIDRNRGRVPRARRRQVLARHGTAKIWSARTGRIFADQWRVRLSRNVAHAADRLREPHLPVLSESPAQTFGSRLESAVGITGSSSVGCS